MKLVMLLHWLARNNTMTRPKFHRHSYAWDLPSRLRTVDQYGPHERARPVSAGQQEQPPATHSQNSARHSAQSHTSVCESLRRKINRSLPYS